MNNTPSKNGPSRFNMGYELIKIISLIVGWSIAISEGVLYAKPAVRAVISGIVLMVLTVSNPLPLLKERRITKILFIG